LKVGENEFANEAVANKTTPEPHGGGVSNTSIPYGLELAIIPYFTNQSVDP